MVANSRGMPRDARALTEALGGKWRASATAPYGSAPCPAHDDHAPSLSISERGGKLLVRCHAGCEQEAVLAGLRERGLWPGAGESGPSVGKIRITRTLPAQEPAPEPHNEPSRPVQVVARYEYRDEHRERLYQSLRMEPKTFRQRRPDGAGGWIWNLDGVRLVPYRLPELLEADPARTVYVVEGEKDADRLASIGLVATTNAMGAGKWRDEYAEHFRGRHVVILPDNDQVGRDHAEAVCRSLLGIAASVRVVELPDVPEKGDVSDWLDAGGHRPRLEELVAGTEPRAKPERTVQTLGELLRSETVRETMHVDGVLWADRVTWAFGHPGTGKTLFWVWLLLHVAAGRTFCNRETRQGSVLLIEEDSPFSVLRNYLEEQIDICGIEDVDSLPFVVNRSQGLSLTTEDGYREAVAVVEACPWVPTIVGIDAMERLVPSESFTTSEVEWFRKFLRYLLDRGITPVVIDHTNKRGGKKGESVEPIDLLYGARAKSAMADVMMYFKGNPTDGLEISFPKFRGERKQPLDTLFTSDQGWTIKAGIRMTLNETERKVMKALNEKAGTWYAREDIEQRAGVSERSCRRALGRLAERGMAEARGSTNVREYRVRLYE
jgi:hypothetical protein